MKLNYVDDFIKFTQEVTNWNIAAGNSIKTVKQERETQLLKQMEYARSEIEETIDAIYDKDKKEIVDGICDTFVTVSYYCVLTNVFTLEKLDNYNYKTKYDICLLPTTLSSLYSQVIQLHKDMYSMESEFVYEKLYLLMCSFVNICGSSNMVNWFMQQIIDSNNSKFIPIQHYIDHREEHNQFVQSKYKSQFHNIVPIKAMFGDKIVIVFRADNGIGKILKPMTFIEPNIKEHADILPL